MSPTELSKLYGFSQTTIRRYIKLGRIRATKLNGNWHVEEEDYKDFLKGKYVRRSPIFNKELENYSPRECADILGCSVQRIYHHLRTGHIKATRHKCAYVINVKDLMEYKSHLVPYEKKVKSYRKKYRHLPYKSLQAVGG